MYYIFSFRSRNQSMRFYEMLKRENVFSKLVSTPRAVSVGCGLSVQVSTQSIDEARRIFSYGLYDTFLGLFYIDGGYIQRVGGV